MRVFVNYFVFTLMIFISGNPFFSGQEWILICLVLILILFAVNKISLTLSKEFLFVFLIFFIIEFNHLIFGKNTNQITFLGTFLRIILAYFFVQYFRNVFFTYFIRVIYFFSVLSLFFFLLSFVAPIYTWFLSISNIFTPPFSETLSIYESSPSLIVYTLHPLHVFRNCGPFWEPGGFSVFLLLGLVFSSYIFGFRFNKYVFVFLITILSTFSTLGYIGVLAYFFFYIYKFNLKVRLFYYFVGLIGLYFIIFNIDFLGEKIIHNIEVADETTGSRFGSALADFQLILNSPIIGNGRGFEKFGIDSSEQFNLDFHRNNGLTNILVLYGIPFFIVLLFLFYKKYIWNFKFLNIPLLENYFFLVVLILCFFTQILLFRPFILSLLFLPIYSIYEIRFSNSNIQ